MLKTKSFYYKFNPLNIWMILNTAFIIIFTYTLFTCPYLAYWWQVWVLIGVLGFSVMTWAYKYALKHRMALIDDKSITIDHCAPLLWTDAAYAEERIVNCFGKKRRVIIIVPKPNIDYKYNFLQKHNAGFTPFSIPLYGIISDSDAEEIKKIISEKIPYKTTDK